MIQSGINLLWRYRRGLLATFALILWTWVCAFLLHVTPKQLWMIFPAVVTVVVVWALLLMLMIDCWVSDALESPTDSARRQP